MKVKVAIAVVLMAINVFSAGAENSKIEKAKELMKTMEITKNIDASFNQIVKFSEKMIDSQELSEEQATKAKEIAKKSMEITFSRMKKIDWVTIFSEVYASVFTEEELQELIDFFYSPLGQKMLKKQPELMQATMKRMQVEMSKIMPEIQNDIKDAIEEVKKKNKKESSASETAVPKPEPKE